MSYDVTSFFIDELTSNEAPNVFRQFFIGDSDYTSNVLKWPRIKKEWDNPKPISATADLSNAENDLGFLRLDKTLLTSECVIKFGLSFNVIDRHDIDRFYGQDWDVRSNAGEYFSYGWMQESGYYFFGKSNLDSDYKRLTIDSSDPGNLQLSSLDGVSFDEFTDLGFSGLNCRGLCFADDGRKMLMHRRTGQWLMYDVSTPYDFSPGNLTGANSNAGTILPTGYAFHLNNEGTRLYSLNSLSPTTYQVLLYTLTEPYSMSSAELHSAFNFDSSSGADDLGMYIQVGQGEKFIALGTNTDIAQALYVHSMGNLYSAEWVSSLDVSSIDPGLNGVYLSPDAHLLNIQGILNDAFFTSSVAPIVPGVNTESIEVFRGKIESVGFKKNKCSIRMVDKMIELSNRVIGSDENPFAVTNQLVSDVALWVVNSYGGFDDTASTSNTDINWTKFEEWAAVMSGDSINVSTNMKGIKVTEALRKIARMTRSAIYIEENKLVFSRFSEIAPPVFSISEDRLLDSVLSIKSNDIVNKQYVRAGYDVDSDYFSIEVNDTLASSVNSYGLYERVEGDKSIWYPNSSSALNLAQRLTFTNGEPIDRISAKAPIMGIFSQIGDTVTYVDNNLGISDNYRIMSNDIDIDRSAVSFTFDQSQLVNPFYLDITSLDGTEVLT